MIHNYTPGDDDRLHRIELCNTLGRARHTFLMRYIQEGTMPKLVCLCIDEIHRREDLGETPSYVGLIR